MPCIQHILPNGLIGSSNWATVQARLSPRAPRAQSLRSLPKEQFCWKETIFRNFTVKRLKSQSRFDYMLPCPDRVRSVHSVPHLLYSACWESIDIASLIIKGNFGILNQKNKEFIKRSSIIHSGCYHRLLAKVTTICAEWAINQNVAKVPRGEKGEQLSKSGIWTQTTELVTHWLYSARRSL